MKGEKPRALDRTQLLALLRAYLRMSASGASLLRSRGKPTPLAFVLSMYAFLGLLIGLGALTHIDVLPYAVALHCITFFIVGMAAVIESNDVLFDPKEEEILLHRPIPPGTLLAAKGLALVGFTLMLAGALNLFPTFFLLAAGGAAPWIPLVHVVSIVLLDVFVCAAVVCCYGFILRFFGRERFESLAVFAQVGMTLLFVGSFQVLPRMLERMGPEKLGSVARLLLPAPPAWFAAIDAILGAGVHDRALFLAAGAGIVMTALLCWIGVGKLAQGYGESLPLHGQVPERHDAQRADAGDAKGLASAPATWRTRNPILRMWLKDPIEWSAFRMAAAYMRRDREVKLRMYSSMSMFVVFTVLSFLDSPHHRAQFMPLMMLAMAGTIPLTVLETMRMSSHFAAAEIFQAAPLASASAVFHGVRKASVLFVQAPIVAWAVTLIVLRSGDVLDTFELAVPILIALPTLSLAPGVFGTYLPLSIPVRRGRQSSQNVGVVFATMILTGGVVGLGYLARSLGLLWVLVGIEIVALFLVNRGLLGYIRAKRMNPWIEEAG